MGAVNIIIAIILIVIIYYVLSKTLLKTNIVYDQMLDAMDPNPEYEGSTGFISNVKQNMIPNALLSDYGSTNFMISTWFYIDSWETNIGDSSKNILFIGDAANNILHNDIATANDFVGLSKTICGNIVGSASYKSLSLTLDKYENNLFIDIATHTDNNCNENNKRRFTRYAIENIPIQKWNCLTISVDSLLMDVYMDGKLINSFILHGVYRAENEPNIYLGKLKSSGVNSSLDDGFSGFITRVRYEGNAINSQEALNIYKAGINSSLLKSIFNKYSLKVSFLEYNKEKGSFKI